MSDALLDKVRERAEAIRLQRDSGAFVSIEAVMRDVATALVLARREGYVESMRRMAVGGTMSADPDFRERHAADCYPLPTGTRQVLREEPDPHHPDRMYRATNEIRPSAAIMHLLCGIVQPYEAWPPPTVERVELWASMMREPYRTEEVPGDESDPWGAGGAVPDVVRPYIVCTFGGCQDGAVAGAPDWKDYGGHVGWRCPMHGTKSHLL